MLDYILQIEYLIRRHTYNGLLIYMILVCVGNDGRERRRISRISRTTEGTGHMGDGDKEYTHLKDRQGKRSQNCA